MHEGFPQPDKQQMSIHKGYKIAIAIRYLSCSFPQHRTAAVRKIAVMATGGVFSLLLSSLMVVQGLPHCNGIVQNHFKCGIEP